MFNLIIFANDTINYSYNVELANSNTSWTAQTQVVNLDYELILDNSNVNVGLLNTTVTPLTSSNTENFTINFVANSYQTMCFANGGVNPSERPLLIQTVLYSNTGIVQHANNLTLIVKTADI